MRLTLRTIPLILCLAIMSSCARTDITVGGVQPHIAEGAPYSDKTVHFGEEEEGVPAVIEVASSTIEIAEKYRFDLGGSIKQALMHNLSLMNAADGVRRSHYNIIAAESEFELKITPKAGTSLSGTDGSSEAATTFGLEASKRLPYGSTIGTFGDIQKRGDQHSSRVGMELTQPLLRGFGREVTQHNLLAARFAALSSERSFIQFQETLILSVVRGYYDIIRYRELVELNEQSAARTERHMKAARARERVGLASRIDVLRAEIQLSQAQDNLVSTREALESAIDNFRVLLGFDPQKEIEVVSDLSYNEFEVDVDLAIELAMRNRLDLAIARDEINEAERSVRVSKNHTRPQLDLVLGYQWIGTGDTFRNSGPDEGRWMMGLSTSTDVRRTADHARYEQSKLDLDGRIRNYRFMRDTVVREVKDAVRQLEKNMQRMNIQQSEIRFAKQKMRLAQIKFERGLADNFELVDAEEQVTRAETAYVSAITDYIIAQTHLKKTIGTLIERPENLLR